MALFPVAHRRVLKKLEQANGLHIVRDDIKKEAIFQKM